MSIEFSGKPAPEFDALVHRIVMETEVDDVHTHLYDPAFSSLLLWGIDDLLVYHYLVSESFRQLTIPYDIFWKMTKEQQAETIWKTLFLEHSPLSEATRGVLTVLQKLGLDVRSRDLPKLRRWFAEQDPKAYVSRCMELARVKSICMTNSPFDPEERAVWDAGFEADSRFKRALRIDPLLLAWPTAAKELARQGYAVGNGDLNDPCISEIRRFLADWTRRIGAGYVMVSLPPEFRFPSTDISSLLIERAVIPHCLEHGIPFALMPGVRRGVNPELRLAGDAVALCDMTFVTNLCSRWPEARFLITALARENQYELTVLARKFRNLHVFGCWWFTNIPYLIDELTRLRLELLGPSFTFQHSDARVLDQLLYKWDHSRAILARVLSEKYRQLALTGWMVTEAEIRRDVRELLGGSFELFTRATPRG